MKFFHLPPKWQWWHLPHSGLQQPQSVAVEQVGAAQAGAAQAGAAQSHEALVVQEVAQPQL